MSAADAMSAGDSAGAVVLAVEKRISDLTAADERILFSRGRAADPAVEAAVREIIEAVRTRGDAALHEMARRFDGVELDAIEVPLSVCRAALDALDPDVRRALEQAATAIRRFHEAQLPAPLELEVAPGVRLGRVSEPLRRVGVYAPGGRASYPSSVLMGVVPANVAGVEEVVVCSPPAADGLPPAAVLAASALGGANRVYAIGGAGAVAAMALGTDSVPVVDKIVGPGNAYVNEAKRQLVGSVGIDNPAGPSEVLVIADGDADPELCAVELLAQAEHDPDAAVALVTTSPDVAAGVGAALDRLVPTMPRRQIVEAALRTSGAILIADSETEMLELASRYAPEHLIVLTGQPRATMAGVRAAGTVFLGAASSVAFGDYMTGANHVLPTNGLARVYSGLSTLDFLRFYTYQELTPEAAASISGPTATLAEAEGLPAHALAARLRGVASAAPADLDSRSAGAGAGGQDTSGARVAERQEIAASDPRIQRAPAELPRAAYANIELYEPGRVPTPTDLSDNTNLYGVAPAAARVLSEAAPAAITRYPSVFADRLKRALAERHGVAPENVATGCGSDDVIDSALRAFLEPGDSVAYPVPTFGVMSTFARMNAARPVEVPLGPGFELDTAALLAAGAGATYLCRPNNPTGNAFARRDVQHVMRDAAGIVLLDEAYADFADDHLTLEAAASDRTLSLRTLSKAWSLAGLRIGYAIGPAALVREVEKSRGPFKVGGLAEAAALAALEENGDWVDACIADVLESRSRLRDELLARDLQVWPSAANFLLVSLPDRAGAARDLASRLRGRGVQVRAFPALPQAGESIRVGIGPWPMMQKFLEALDASWT